jgi:hypothetical protein
MVAPEGVEPSIPKAAVSKTAAYAFRHGAKLVLSDAFESSSLVFQTSAIPSQLTQQNGGQGENRTLNVRVQTESYPV